MYPESLPDSLPPPGFVSPVRRRLHLFGTSPLPPSRRLPAAVSTAAPPCRSSVQWRIQGGGGVTWVMTPPPWGPGAPQACQGHHRPIRGTTGLTGAPQTRQGHHRPSKGTTGLSGAPQACQEHHRPSKSTTGLPGAPQTYQEGHQRPARGTTGLSGHLRLVRGTTVLSGPRGTSGLAGAPQARQGHHRTARGTTGLA